MAGPILTPALVALRAGFNTAAPNRDKTSDGWIGDTAHQAEVSGHNPDDTAGVRAEYSDSDSIPEVRAVDVDADLRQPGLSMALVIQRILSTPADLARLRYIIFCPPTGPLGTSVPTIWSRNSGWKPVRYTGSNRHDKHAHFSGDPNTDTDARTWSVAQMGAAMSEYTDSGEFAIDAKVSWELTCLLGNLDSVTWKDPTTKTNRTTNNNLKAYLVAQFGALLKANAELVQRVAELEGKIGGTTGTLTVSGGSITVVGAGQ